MILCIPVLLALANIITRIVTGTEILRAVIIFFCMVIIVFVSAYFLQDTKIDIYKKCITLQNELITLRHTKMADAPELLKCYSDEKAVPLFNSDNCNGDNFYYSNQERMEQAIDTWNKCYEAREFVRWSVIYNKTREIIGTVEMFNRGETLHYGIHGILRIDLRSSFEKSEVIESILGIANHEFFDIFSVGCIATKAIPQARERLNALNNMGYSYMDQFGLADYFGKTSERPDKMNEVSEVNP
jgi:RimJ/RimL family protein N-acetyltransferase